MLFRRSKTVFTQIRTMCKKNIEINNNVPVRQIPPVVVREYTFKNCYNKVFGKYLFLTNTLTSGALMALGDIVQQEIEFRRDMLDERYDWYRLGRMFLVGLVAGPLHHVFYHYLERFYPKRNLFTVTKKVLLDQIIMSPVFIVGFFYGMGLLEKKTFRECTNEVNDKFVEAYLVDWVIWPPAQFVNFYFLPLKYQVIYVNVITMLYNIYLSYIKHRDQDILEKTVSM